VNLTEEQARAVDLFQSSRALKISAFAGTGKTSTLTAVAESTSKNGLYLAFNKSIAAEAKTKFPRSVDCRTTHSLAFRAVPSIYRGNEAKLTHSLHSNHVVKLLGIEEVAVGGISLKPRTLGFLTAKTVQRFCQSGDVDVGSSHVPLSGKLDKIEPQYQDLFKGYIVDLAAHLWDRMLDPADSAPLGHDGYLKLWSLSGPRLDYDYLLLDEAQDTNEAVLSVLRRQDSHLTLVGDRHQQIYEWRGAINAMESVETDAEAFLTRSFRFGDAVADAATSILRVLGEERRVIGNPQRATRISATGTTETILCRTNAGVVAVVIEALAAGRPPYVVGGVNELIRMLEDVSKLKRSIPAECAEFFGFKDWTEVVDFSGSDEGESLRSFVSIVQTYGELTLIQRLNSVCREETSASLTVSTGHKAKGREWDSVTLFTDFEPRPRKDDPSKLAMNREEARLLYVAATRARQLLVVPPRLAERWNVPPAPTGSVVQPLTPPLPQVPRQRPPPKLPSFATVVTPRPSSSASTQQLKSALQAGQDKRPQMPSLSQPGFISSVLSIFRGKR
jgi:superfamily I DNA/RNA helicase